MQPIWKEVWCTDRTRLLEDTTGVYDPELEIADEIDEDQFELYRFELPRLKRCPRSEDRCECLIPHRWSSEWPYGSCKYNEWFVESLDSVASYIGATERELRSALCSKDINKRAWAYESIASYHGNVNFDSYPLTLTSEELDARWSGDE